jgi:hypothetical protein
MEVNGKFYPLWGQFVERQNEWVGGILQDFGDTFDRGMGAEPKTTLITKIELKPNGDDSAWFGVIGEGFECGFDITVGGIVPGEQGWITFNGYGGHTWRIKIPQTNKSI